MTIVNNTVNDVALTVLPDAPIDPATGLQVPTIAVATDGGVSVIKDDGTVVDSSLATAIGSVDIFESTLFWARHDFSNDVVYVTTEIGAKADGFGASFTFNKDHPAYLRPLTNDPDVLGLSAQRMAVGAAGVGLQNILLGSTAASSMVAYTTSTYNTGWMNGDIKGAFLADTDDTDLVATELVTNGTFDTDTSGWSVGNSNAANTTLASTSSQLVVTSIVNDTNGHWAQQAFSTVVGKTYTVSAEYVGQSNTSVRFARVGGVSITASSGIIASASNPDVGVFNITFVATSTTTYVAVGHVHSAAPATSTWDNISVKLADADRSVNG